MIKRLTYLAAMLIFSSEAVAQQQDSLIPMDKAYKRTYNIERVTDGSRPTIDGKLDEPFWQQAQWSEKFVQITPYERVPSPSPTRVKLTYDDKNIYVGIECKDAKPDEINKFTSNRDYNVLGDVVSVAFDTYHDYRAAAEFNINAGGNKTDLVVTDKLSINLSWNAVWEGRTYINVKDSVWYAELSIPFSQLRYNKDLDDASWGLHVRRIIRRNSEVQNWSMIPLKNNGHVYSFGNMEGLTDLPKPKGIEFLPYAMTKLTNAPIVEGSPFSSKNEWGLNGGLDAKFALKDFTMDVTINPDYGQVELDPSVMNLTAYETFYDEKRPFFLEGKHILDFANGDDMMFYTRRIGSMPSYTPSSDNVNTFASQSSYIPIIGALKLTGTDKKGLTIGLIESVTAQTFADYSSSGNHSRVMTEPLTNYTVLRLQKNWDGNTLLGGMLTSVNRANMSSEIEDIMVKDAFTGGIDFTQYFKNRLYYIDSKIMASSLNGSAEAIYNLQTDAVHYFQRESSQDYLGVDDQLTSMMGTGGYLKVGRKGNAKFIFSQAAGWSSPSFDLNDIGYLRQSDNIYTETELNYRHTDIWHNFRYNNIILSQGNNWNFGGTSTDNYVALSWQAMTLDRFDFLVKEQYGWNYVDTRMLRGGPNTRFNPYFQTTVTGNTDKAKRTVLYMVYSGNHKTDGYNRYDAISPYVTLRAGNKLLLTGQLDMMWNRDNMQYVATVKPTNSNGEALSNEYIMGYLDQKTYGLTIKAQLNVTPDLSFQYYGSPFTSVGKYSNFKEADQTTAASYSSRYRMVGSDNITLTDGTYNVSRDGASYSFANPDFSFNEFRSNLVIRWEYMRGSTMYLVWENTVSNNTSKIIGKWGDNLNQMFTQPATNTIMLKVNYWFSL